MHIEYRRYMNFQGLANGVFMQYVQQNSLHNAIHGRPNFIWGVMIRQAENIVQRIFDEPRQLMGYQLYYGRFSFVANAYFPWQSSISVRRFLVPLLHCT